MKSNSSTIVSLSDYAGTPLTKAYQSLELEKAGEGSRGGKVIGHTKSGKAVYEHFDHPKHQDFSAQEHTEAADIQHQRSNKPSLHHDFKTYAYGQSYKHRDAAQAKQSGHGLKVGEKYRTDSGLGGEFTVKYHGKDAEGKHEFHNVTNKDFAGAKYHVHEDKLGEFLKKAGPTGPGSKGGHVVGQTKSGKPIYGNIADSQKHDKKYTFEDHEDAASHHRKQSNKYKDSGPAREGEGGNHGVGVSDREKYAHHNSNANYHEIQADKKGKAHVAGAKGNVFEHHARKIAVANSRMPDAIRGMFEKSQDAYELLGLKLEKAGEGSKGGKIIGHTRSGKPIYDSDHENYTEKRKYPKYSGTVRTSEAVGGGAKGAHAHFASKHEGWSKQDHEEAAQHHYNATKEHERKWGEKQKEAHQNTFKKDPEYFDYKVSGIGRDEYSEKHKDELRHHAHKQSEHREAAHAHMKFASGGKKGWQDLRSKNESINKSIAGDEMIIYKHKELSKAEEAYALLGLEVLSKSGGEGSRGGHIIGHTHTGKAIYDKFEHEGHKDYNSNDHQGAAKFHLDAAHHKYFEGKHAEQSKHLDEARKHQLEGFSRHVDSFNEVYNNPKVKVLTISSKNPLSSQLSKLTGDSWNSSDFSGGAGIGNVFTHHKTGQQFTAINEREADILKKYKR